MKRRYNILMILAAALVLFVYNGCKDDDDYNYNDIIPVLVGGITGTNTPIAHGQTAYPYTYKVVTRGGSSYNWTVEGIDATIVQDEDVPSTAYITFAASSDTVDAVIKVVETTMGGKVSEAAELPVTLTPFCALDLDAFVGDYIEDDAEGQTANVTIARDPDDGLFGLVITGVLSEDYWFGTPGGTLKIKLNGCNNSVKVESQETGITYGSYGAVYMSLADDTVWGTFDPDTKTIVFDGEVYVSAGSFGTYTFTYTKQ